MRKGDDLDFDDAIQLAAGLHHAFQRDQPLVCVYVDMGADQSRAVADRLQRLPHRLGMGVQPIVAFHLALIIDLVDQAWADFVDIPRVAQQRFVEMGVGIDETRDCNTSAGVLDR